MLSPFFFLDMFHAQQFSATANRSTYLRKESILMKRESFISTVISGSYRFFIFLRAVLCFEIRDNKAVLLVPSKVTFCVTAGKYRYFILCIKSQVF